MKAFTICLAAANIATCAASVLQPRQSTSNTATVNLSVKRGTPKHLASGIIYGTPDTLNQIPDQFYTQAGINYGRAGGAQLEAPSRGWIWNEYQGRFQSTLNNYKTIRKYGGSFVLLPHDIWGTDHANSSTVWPGDNGDFSDYDKFLDRLFADIRANNMLPGLVFDIWNEPDLCGGTCGFWTRGQQQYLNLYLHSHKRIRADPALKSMLISGPSYSAQPTTDNTWWTNWLQLVKQNNIVPDQYSWHIEGDTNNDVDDLQTNNVTLKGMLAQYGLPSRQVNINEYAVFSEQVAAGAAWWISRLERYDTIGQRGNWLSGNALHDFLASLVSKPNANTASYDPKGTGYFANGEWQVYKYYATNQTGTRVATEGTGDRIMDVYTTIGSDRKVRTLTGVRLQTGTWYITINKLSSLGLPASGSLPIQTWGFVDNGHYGRVDAPTNRGVFSHTYSGDSVTFPVYQTSQDKFTAWAFEFSF